MNPDQLRLDIERLTDHVEAKFQYIRDIQGSPIEQPELLTVVNVHGEVIGDIVRYLRRLTTVVEELARAQ